MGEKKKSIPQGQGKVSQVQRQPLTDRASGCGSGPSCIPALSCQRGSWELVEPLRVVSGTFLSFRALGGASEVQATPPTTKDRCRCTVDHPRNGCSQPPSRAGGYGTTKGREPGPAHICVCGRNPWHAFGSADQWAVQFSGLNTGVDLCRNGQTLEQVL